MKFSWIVIIPGDYFTLSLIQVHVVWVNILSGTRGEKSRLLPLGVLDRELKKEVANDIVDLGTLPDSFAFSLQFCCFFVDTKFTQ